jgi:type II secretion system protein L
MSRDCATLRILADDSLQSDTLLWALRDASDRLLDSGVGVSWPDARYRGELVLPTARMRFAEPQLPPGGALLRGVALGYALEDALANAPEDNGYARLVGAAGALVLLTGKAPLDALLTCLRARGFEPSCIVPDAMLLPAPPADGWSVGVDGQGWLLRLDRWRALRLPAAAAVLAAPLVEALGPQRLLSCGGGVLPEALLRLPCESVPAPDWRTARLDAAADLIADRSRVSPQGRRWREALVRAGQIVLLLALCETGFALAESGWLIGKRLSLQHDQRATATRMGLGALPETARLAGARSALDARRLARGLPEQGGALLLMDALAQVMAGREAALHTVEYRNGRLLFTLPPGAETDVARWREALSARHLALGKTDDGRSVLSVGDMAR